MSDNHNPYASSPGAQLSGAVSFGTSATAPGAPSPTGQPGKDLVKDTTTADFARDVMQESKNQPVLVDFWAPWCGPCRQLTPLIEKAVNNAKGRVRLVKLNIDDHPAIPGQMGIQSIPAVVAFVNGQPVDGFMGALPESQINQFIDRIAGPAPAEDNGIEAVVEEAKAALAAGDVDLATQGFSAILQADPANLSGLSGLTTCMVLAGELDAAEELLGSLDDVTQATPEIAAVLKRLAMAREVAHLGNPAELEARLAANPLDHDARLNLAKILNAQGERERAADELFVIMRKDRTWNDDGARRMLVEFFEVWGQSDPATLSARRQLSSLLFS